MLDLGKGALVSYLALWVFPVADLIVLKNPLNFPLHVRGKGWVMLSPDRSRQHLVNVKSFQVNFLVLALPLFRDGDGQSP